MKRTVTFHAEDRADERMKISPKAIAKLAETAREKGIRFEDTAGRLRRFLDLKRHEHPGTQCRIYGEHLFWFRGELLITVYRVQPKFLKTVAKLRQQKRCTVAAEGGE